MPAVEERRIEFRAAPVFFHGGIEIADGEVAIGVVEEVVEFGDISENRPG